MSKAGLRTTYDPCTVHGDRVSFPDRSLRKRWTCVWISIGCSCILSLLTSAFLVLLALQVSTLRRSLLTENRQNVSSHISDIPRYEFLQDDNVKVSGSFKIDQNILYENGSVRYTADKDSAIKPLSDSECLRIPVSGKYLIISRFTFRVPSISDVTLLTHYLLIRDSNGQQKDFSFRRKYVSLMENKVRSGKDLRKASLFIEFYDIDENERICANTSKPQLLYASSLDNDINIIKQLIGDKRKWPSFHDCIVKNPYDSDYYTGPWNGLTGDTPTQNIYVSSSQLPTIFEYLRKSARAIVSCCAIKCRILTRLESK